MLVQPGTVRHDTILGAAPPLSRALHGGLSRAEVDRDRRPVGEHRPLNRPVGAEVLVGYHALVAHGAVDVAAFPVGLRQALLALALEAQAQRACPEHGLGAVQGRQGHLAVGQVGTHTLQIADGVAPVPGGDHAVVEHQLPEGHAALMADAVCQVLPADLVRTLHRHQMAGGPAKEVVARHHPLLVVEHGGGPRPAVLPAEYQALLPHPPEQQRQSARLYLNLTES